MKFLLAFLQNESILILMKEIRIKTKEKEVRYAKRACHVISILQTLASVGRKRGLTVQDLIDKLTACGVLYPGQDEASGISNLMQSLLRAGVVAHPSGSAASKRYIIKSLPEIIWN